VLLCEVNARREGGRVESTWERPKRTPKGSFFVVLGTVFGRVALCTASRKLPPFCDLAQICDLVKCRRHNELRLVDGREFELFFRVAYVNSIAS
jgi:hypothetical protein